MSKAKPATETAAVILTSMIAMCDLPDFKKFVGVPQYVHPDDIRPFFEGVVAGLELARSLCVGMGDKATYTVEEAEALIGRLADDHSG